jgi:starch phosphorylase
MKFALNGALTIGTLDGANVEMSEQVGNDNLFIFGMTAQQVELRKQAGELNMTSVIAGSDRLSAALEAIRGGVFSPDDPTRYVGLVDALVYDDRFMVCADFDDYWATQRRVDELWQDPARWWRAAVLNTARMGWFSSDRTIREYAKEIWGAPPVG